MPGLVTVTLCSDAVAIITINNPPVNALSRSVAEALRVALDRSKNDPDCRAVVLVGAGRTFIAGADINEINGADGPADLHNLLRAIEDSPKPIVAAIHGAALGGGLELAMAAQYRIMASDAQVGQPEVNLGVIPGAEGTQRLPRLAGVAKAVDMCIAGAPIKAQDALESGIVDQVVMGDVLDEAVKFAIEVVEKAGSPPKTRNRLQKLGSNAENEPIFAAARERAARIRRNQTAPLKAIDAIQAATTLPFEEGCQRERVLSSECLASDQAKSMIHVFFGEREAAKIPFLTKDMEVRPISRVAIIGAGTMGTGIAMAFANVGIPVRLKDADQSALDRGMAMIRKNYEQSMRRGRLKERDIEQCLSLIQPQLDYRNFDEADLIIEAVFEDIVLKKQIFAKIDKIAKAECILASNTSSLDIDDIAKETSRTHDFVGLHFFSPASVMRLVEIVRGRATSATVLATCLALAKKLGKIGIVVGNCRGFVGNRMFLVYMREAQFLVEEGATPEQVDTALYDWGMAMGIFAVDDMAGIDVGWRVRQQNRQFQTTGLRTPLVVDKLYAMGRLGQKTGLGWYRYDGDREPIPDPKVNALIESTALEAGMIRRVISKEEIVERCNYIMINEGARILEEGHALRASDIDIIYISGYGYPVYRGGPMWFADQVGLSTIYKRICDFYRLRGEWWEPSPLLKRLAEKGSTFARFDMERIKSA